MPSRWTTPWPGAGWRMRQRATKPRCAPCSRVSPGWTAGCSAGGERCAAEDAGFAAPTDRAAAMRRVNPWLIPRNHRVEEALTAASDEGDLAPFEQLLNALGDPFVENPAPARYAEPAPDGFMAEFRTFCGT
jgi:serine/tyrosine/threonine adenylyltransferase